MRNYLEAKLASSVYRTINQDKNAANLSTGMEQFLISHIDLHSNGLKQILPYWNVSFLQKLLPHMLRVKLDIELRQ